MKASGGDAGGGEGDDDGRGAHGISNHADNNFTCKETRRRIQD